MNKPDILDQLFQYADMDYVPMHMPGAKRNTRFVPMGNPYGLDITEIDGFDNLHHAQGMIADAFKRCARLFGAEESLFLVNGSTVGILSAVCGATQKGAKIIVARNCHQSVYHALYLNELNPVYLYPDLLYKNLGICGAIRPEQVEQALSENPDAAALVLTSPTYEGVVSDITRIAKIVHRHGAVLIVDEAHGAHFHFSPLFPESAVACGADAVVQSIHKTLPSLTQTALLHLCGPYIDRDRVKMYWDLLQTTSPSYLLMGAIDRCMTILSEGAPLFQEYAGRLLRLRDRLSKLKHIRLVETDDLSKIVLAAADGKQLYEALRLQYHVQLEMASLKYVIAMTGIGDTDTYYSRFAAALEALDADEAPSWPAGSVDPELPVLPAVVRTSIYAARNAPSEYVPLENAAGRVSAGPVCFYPPGIPLVHAGEQITGAVTAALRQGIKAGLETTGLLQDEKGEVGIRCLK